MSAPATAPAPPSAPSAPTTPGAGHLWRRVRGPAAFIAGLIALALLVSLGAQQYREGLLEPEGPNPDGSRALVQILRDRGNEVDVARSAADALEAAGPGGVTVLAGAHRLTREQLDRLSGGLGDRILVRPTTPALNALAPGVRMTGRTEEQTLAPECGLAAAEAAGTADIGGEVYSTEGGGARACYPAAGGHALVRVSGEGHTTTVLGSPAPLTNARLDDEGNAALVLSLIGERDVVWLRPDPVPEQGQSLWQLIPVQLRLALVPLAAALLLLALWRGRRLGPLVTERLPVVVRASETTEGRAGLYAARRARDRAGAALRSGTLRRIRPGLGLGPDAAPTAVVESAAARTGDDPAQLGALLFGPREAGGDDSYTADDNGLVRLADELDALEGRLR
ncbi:DUF4350 domain-containing protein [Streptomonospora litoralis]|uniref:DUF4350 domain-containing protein n=1 Tax=Streptomonospora litoralis TaxID=2498135 RepID=A0A4P6PWY2_9ACTN|nr:DUF4350 domain-containing protein [Streptomonospora litoralis]QBI52746.1 hypothetical protein EKD16_04695 [Streptomonospora litoralis]